MAPQIKIGKPAKMFVYLPVYLATKKKGRPVEGESNTELTLQRIVIQDRMQLTIRIEVGDSFAIRKRDNLRDFLDDKLELRVSQVKWSFIDGSYIVILEDLIFGTKEEVEEFLKNKRSV